MIDEQRKRTYSTLIMNDIICPFCNELVTPRSVSMPNEDGHPEWDHDECPKCGAEI